MKKIIVLASLAVLLSSGFAIAADDGALGITVDTTWVSKYIWRGVDRLDDKAAIQPSVNIDLGSGFSTTVWTSWAGASKNGGSTSTVDADEMRYILSYGNSLNEGDAYAMDYSVNWLYYDYTDRPNKAADAQEINLSVAFPSICPTGVVPNYTIIKLWSAEGGEASNGVGGWIHEFGLDYGLAVPGFIENNPEQVLNFSWDITYNDGAGLTGRSDTVTGTTGGVDSDWSHMTWGVSTDIALCGGTFSPGIYYQVSMEDSINNEDEFWTGVSYSFSF